MQRCSAGWTSLALLLHNCQCSIMQQAPDVTCNTGGVPRVCSRCLNYLPFDKHIELGGTGRLKRLQSSQHWSTASSLPPSLNTKGRCCMGSLSAPLTHWSLVLLLHTNAHFDANRSWIITFITIQHSGLDRDALNLEHPYLCCLFVDCIRVVCAIVGEWILLSEGGQSTSAPCLPHPGFCFLFWSFVLENKK